MTVVKSILHNLHGMPSRDLVDAARRAHKAGDAARLKRAAVLRETHGRMDDGDGRAFEEALAGSRRIE
jgi:hypothetical protein